MSETEQKLLEENASLRKELKETEESLDLILKILEVDDRVNEYSRILHECYELSESEVYSYVAHQIEVRKHHEKLYEKEIEELYAIVKGMMVEQEKDTPENFIRILNEWVCLSITYVGKEDEAKCKAEGKRFKNRDMYEFMRDKKGCCWHISHFMQDMCKRYGIDMRIHKGDYPGHGKHLWNSAIINGKETFFDVTFNLTDGKEDNTTYLFVDREDFIEDHRELFTTYC